MKRVSHKMRLSAPSADELVSPLEDLPYAFKIKASERNIVAAGSEEVEDAVQWIQHTYAPALRALDRKN